VGCVYLLTSPSGKQYVGMTKHTALKRWKHHVSDARYAKWSCALQAAIRKYGADNFTVETLEVHEDWADLVAAEIRLIASLGTMFPKGYNMTSGGEGCVSLPPEVEALRVAKVVKSLTGKKLSEAHRAKLSLSHKGLPSGMKGYKFSEEQKQQMSEAAKRRWADPVKREAAIKAIQDPEAQRKRSESSKGKKRSAESRQRNRESQLLRFSDPAQREAARQRTLAFHQRKNNGT